MPRLVIVGVGSSSTQFTAKLIDEIISGPKGHGLVAAGVYDDGLAGPKARKRIRKQIKRLHAANLSVAPEPNPQTDNRVFKDLYKFKQGIVAAKPQKLLLLIDADFLNVSDYAELFRHIRLEVPNLEMTAICYSGDTPADQKAHLALEHYCQGDRLIENAPVLEAAFMLETNSPLAKAVGSQDKQDTLVTKSLAGILVAPLYRNHEPSFDTQVSRIRQPGKPFIGFAVKTQGLSMKKPTNFFARLVYPILRHTTWRISVEQATECIVNATRSLLQNAPVANLGPNPVPGTAPMTTISPFDQQTIHTTPISVNLIVPFKTTNKKFGQIGNRVQQELTRDIQIQPDTPQGAPQPPSYVVRGFKIIQQSIIKGKGVDLSSNPHLGIQKGKFYCQICVLYAVDGNHISSPAANQTVPAQVSPSQMER